MASLIYVLDGENDDRARSPPPPLFERAYRTRISQAYPTHLISTFLLKGKDHDDGDCGGNANGYDDDERAVFHLSLPRSLYELFVIERYIAQRTQTPFEYISFEEAFDREFYIGSVPIFTHDYRTHPMKGSSSSDFNRIVAEHLMNPHVAFVQLEVNDLLLDFLQSSPLYTSDLLHHPSHTKRDEVVADEGSSARKWQDDMRLLYRERLETLIASLQELQPGGCRRDEVLCWPLHQTPVMDRLKERFGSSVPESAVKETFRCHTLVMMGKLRKQVSTLIMKETSLHHCFACMQDITMKALFPCDDDHRETCDDMVLDVALVQFLSAEFLPQDLPAMLSEEWPKEGCALSHRTLKRLKSIERSLQPFLLMDPCVHVFLLEGYIRRELMHEVLGLEMDSTPLLPVPLRHRHWKTQSRSRDDGVSFTRDKLNHHTHAKVMEDDRWYLLYRATDRTDPHCSPIRICDSVRVVDECSRDTSHASSRRENRSEYHSVSFGAGLWAGVFQDISATPYSCMVMHQCENGASHPSRRYGRIGYVLRLPLESVDGLGELPNVERDDADVFFMPPLTPLTQMFALGEMFHPRTKIPRLAERESVTADGHHATLSTSFVSGLLACSHRAIPSVLLSDREDLPDAFDRIVRNGAIPLLTTWRPPRNDDVRV